jgi:ribosomal protein S18 acetylase RimI-like enzyme
VKSDLSSRTGGPADALDAPIRIRRATPDDVPFLEEMLFEAFHWNPEAVRTPIESLRADPEFRKLLAGWGRTGDTALIGESQGQRIGAAWYRLWSHDCHSYGYVAADTPELGIAVRSVSRTQGVGRSLLRALIHSARGAGIRSLSLSVDPDNFACQLYEAEGFRRIGEAGTSWTLILEL